MYENWVKTSAVNKVSDVRRCHVSLVATSEVDASAITGLHGTLNSFPVLVPDSRIAFKTDIVLPDSLADQLLYNGTQIMNVMGIPLPVDRLISQVSFSDIVIIPSLYLNPAQWPHNPYPDLTDWLLAMHRAGSQVCSACTGALLLAETGLLDGYEATQHWAFEELFRDRFPEVKLVLDRVLLRTGGNRRIIMTGASAAWHDLIIYLLTSYAGSEAAQKMAKYYLLCLHNDGQAPYFIFEGKKEHGDNVILQAQLSLESHSAETDVLEKVVASSGLSGRTFQRRFQQATSCTPTAYLQHVRIENAKSELTSTHVPIDSICWQIGYEDPSFFRKLFKRYTGMTPKAYRTRFSLTDDP